MSTPLVWLITGSTSGFGSEIAKAALARGDHVIATARDPTKASMTELTSLGASALALDITNDDTVISSAVASAVAIHGRLDIVLNNAAYILEGAVEECSSDEVSAMFDTNVFGQLRMLRAVLPYMRAARSGVVANMGSIGGWGGMANGSLYCASKCALLAISEGLRLEVAHLGIDVTLIEPGYFRTDFLSGGHKVTPKRHIADLDPATKPVRDALVSLNREQPGDPAKGARLIVEALTKSGRCHGRSLPRRLLLGSDAIEFTGSQMETWQKEIAEWKELTLSTDHDDVAKK